jgi:hypothetical protein
MVLGYGIVAYRDILQYLMFAFCFFALLSVPAMKIYNQGDGYDID